MRELLKASAGDRLDACFVLACMTGMREDELLGLRWRYVDLDAGTVQVAATSQRTENGFTLPAPKTERSRRILTLGPGAVAALRHHRARQAEERLGNADLWTDLDLVFPNVVGRPMEAGKFLRRVFFPLLDKVGLCRRPVVQEKRRRRGREVTVERVELKPLIRFHDLRHSFASLALERNVHPSVVSAVLGHARTSTMLDTCTYLQPGMTAEAATVVEKLISQAGVKGVR